MENLEKALKERKLSKAKYIKRTGGPGHYKYQYKKGAPGVKAAKMQKPGRVERKGKGGISSEEKKIDRDFQGKYKELVNHPDYDPDSYDAQIPAEYMGEAVSEKMELCKVDTSKWTDNQHAFVEDLEMYLVNDYGLKKEKVAPLSLIEGEMKKIDNGTYKLKSSDYSSMDEKKFLDMMSG